MSNSTTAYRSPAQTDRSMIGVPAAAAPFAVGDVVTPRIEIIEECDDYHPQYRLAAPGERLIVRQLINQPKFQGIAVSHDGRTDGNTFNVTAAEIELLR